MQKKHYRVELNKIDTDKTYHSNDCKYGSSFDFKHYQHFLNSYLQIMFKNNISTDFLPSINNQIYINGNDYLKVLSNSIVNEEYIDIYKVTGNPNHQNQTLPIKYMNEFIQSFDEENKFIEFDNGIYLWETILEIVRESFYKHCPKRLSSIFFFDSISSCNYYISNHLNGIGKIYEIEILETERYFEADMAHIDKIENQILFEDLINEFANYWKGTMSENPVKEIIFQGKYKYKSCI
jgi:hypothetical protein